MGKSVGFLGPISGRVGNTVGYVLKDAGKQTQGWRVYQPIVGNPQTDAQMQQRIRLAAINNQYRALKEIITRGFEGLNYGNVSRRKYLSMAMGQRFEGPWLVKDDKRPVPVLNIPLTMGGLPQITATYDAGGEEFETNIVCPEAVTDIGSLSVALIANGYQAGDQVTFIFAKTEGAAVLNVWVSIYIDPESLEEFPSLLDGVISTSAPTDGILNISCVDGWAPDAVAIAVSRDGDGSHLRSTSYWAINDDMESQFYDPAAYRQNAPSYIRHRGASTNWELDAETEGGGGGGGSVQLAYTISGLEIEPQGLTVYSANNPIQIIGANGNQFYIRTKSGGNLAYVNAAGSVVSEIDGATNANTVDVYLERNKAQNLRQWLINQGIQATILPAYT